MNRSRDWSDSLLPEHSALQHEHAPRPLPLFLELVRQVGERDPETAGNALLGLAAYQRAERPAAAAERAETARVGPATLRDHGGEGPLAILVPSLINPPNVLDLDGQVSLAAAIAGMGRHVFLLDWGAAAERGELSVSDHVEHLLVPLLAELDEPPALLGYCLGGTMALAAANLVAVERIATLAAPWRFSNYPQQARSALRDLWSHAHGSARALGALPMEVLQAAFWALDPERTVSKFAEFHQLEPGSPQARRFVALEDWANEGEPLPYPAARELIEHFFAADLPGRGEWRIARKTISPLLPVPLLHCLAARDRIAPAATAAPGNSEQVPAGHVGMVVGSARHQLHEALRQFLGCR